MKRSLLLLAALLPVLVLAQVPQPKAPPSPKQPPLPGMGSATPTPPTSPIWKCTLPGGTYEVALRAISAVSSHEYLIDGGVRVTEVNIATNGSLLARFYYLEPNTNIAPSLPGAAVVDRAQSLVTDAASRTGVDVWQKVIKSYPTSTHAHTVEYRLTSKESLQALFSSAEQAFLTGKPGAYSGE
jgi:hypothetical protein